MVTGRSRLLQPMKDVLWALAIAGMVAGIGRFAFGLGASTNMMDALPWGWWKVFNMVAGAALATSGFVVASIIYIFQMERYRPVARVSVLVGFLGYGSSLFALIFDIGLPHRGWHPFFMWNPHSFLFEVFWCVSMYWGVTALELVPIVTERFPLKKITHWMHERMLPFVVLGITLSTMHHSSLGSIFMASPTRLHPLWFSLWIPPEFLVSAMGGGIATIILLMLFTGRLYGRPNDPAVLSGLAKGSAWLLAIYAVIRTADFTVNGKWNFVFGPDQTWESRVFFVEILLQAIIPVVLFSRSKMRCSTAGLTVAGVSAFLGLAMHRIDTGIVGYFRSSNAVYFPNVSELVISFGVLAIVSLVFFFLLERFHVIDDAGRFGDAPGHEPPKDVWTREEGKEVTGAFVWRLVRIAVLFTPITWAALKSQATGAFEPIRQPVNPAVIANDEMRTKFSLDANRNGMVTAFDHKKHQEEFLKVYEFEKVEETCIKCHHLNYPADNNTSCRRCHLDMEVPTPMFRMVQHEERFEKEEDRREFLAADLSDRRETYEACVKCHRENMVGLASYEKKGFAHLAPGYKDAMHGSCLECHRLREQEKKEDPALPTSRGNCVFCHRDWADPGMFEELVVAAEDGESGSSTGDTGAD
jgi:Ni/Fe-hydrogenase subunit HybB-like protein